MKKNIMYKYYEKSEYVIITEKDGYILVSEYVDFIKSGKRLIGRNKEYTWKFWQVEDYYLKLGYL